MRSRTVAVREPRQQAPISAIVTRGEADEIAFVFSAGSAVGPFSVGSRGDWRIAAQDVAPLHFYLCFDGETLFGAAAPGSSPARVAGEPLGTVWSKLPDTCEIAFGGASIVLSRSDGRGARIGDPFAADTIAKPFLSFLAGSARVRAEDPFAAATVARQPYETAARRPNGHRPPRDPMAVETIAVPLMRQQPIADVGVTAPSRARGAPDRAEASPAPSAPSGTPLVRKVLAALVVAAVVLMGARLFKARSAAEPSAAVVATQPPAPPSAPPKSAALRPKRPAPAALPLVGGKTPERQAVDRVARGAYADAASLYEQLAQRSNDPTFIAAARIARRKARVP